MFVEPVAEQMTDIVITEEMILSKLQTLRVDKAAGVDDMSPRLFKSIHEQIVHSAYLLLLTKAMFHWTGN